jgi:serine/threonine protein kinase
MTEDPSSIHAIFCAAIEIAAPEERERFVEQACGEDRELRSRVQTLLGAYSRAGSFLESAAPGLTNLTQRIAAEHSFAEHSFHVTVGSNIGGYRVLKQIGEGGIGAVFLAEQSHPVRRNVALKVIKLGMDTQQVIARFEAERQALAMMNHPHIAKVFDAGSTEFGRPYFVMELVDGIPITDYCDQNRLNVRQRQELFIQVCQAVQHAHQKGLIHRDIKPSNVLVSTMDDRPVAKVIDFGIAKATGANSSDKTLFTEWRQLVGTLEYMSPEQADGSLDIDTRTDVYSLGVVLYELLTGTTPFEGRELRAKTYEEIQRTIRDVEPPKPSTRLSKTRSPDLAARRRVEPRQLNASIRGELDWIVMKCLEKDRARRYESAAALAADIFHHLADEPVAAAAPSRTYRLRKFVRRNKVPVFAATAVVVALVAGVIGTTAGLIIARQQRAVAQKRAQEARDQASIAQAVSQFQADMLASADPRKLLGNKVTVLQVVTAAVKELDEGKLEDQPLVEAAVRETIGNTLQSLGSYDEAEPNLRKALELRRKYSTSGPIAAAAGNLGSAVQAQGKLAEAELLFREALEIQRRSLPPEPLHLSIALKQPRPASGSSRPICRGRTTLPRGTGRSAPRAAAGRTGCGQHSEQSCRAGLLARPAGGSGGDAPRGAGDSSQAAPRRAPVARAEREQSRVRSARPRQICGRRAAFSRSARAEPQRPSSRASGHRQGDGQSRLGPRGSEKTGGSAAAVPRRA